ncbi:hypothetical protein HK405_013814, partial [Cladochytrium tenue]
VMQVDPLAPILHEQTRDAFDRLDDFWHLREVSASFGHDHKDWVEATATTADRGATRA